MSIQTISPQQLKEKIDNNNDLYILDVRAEDKFKDYHIAQSKNMPKNLIFEHDEEVLAALPKDKEIIITCTTGNSARKCADILAENNFKVTVLEGGLTAWKEQQEK